MSEKKSESLKISNLEYQQVVWSSHFKTYVMYLGSDYDNEALFKFMFKDGYCVIEYSDIIEPSSLIKELL
jgi:hypothetical protein